jgi:hypothetical protein
MGRRLARLLIVVAAGALLMAPVAGLPGLRFTWGPEEAVVRAQGSAPLRIDGKPNLSGIWQAFTTAGWDLEDHNAQKGEPAGQGIVAGGSIPYQPWALAKKEENYRNRMKADPVRNCYMPGVPRLMYMPFPFEIFQTSELLLITFEYNHMVRWLWTDGRPHPEALEFWMGESRGHWEGDTLVVETKNFNGQAWFDAAGNFHSNELRVVERFAPTGPNHISYEAMIEDPKVFTRPWKIAFPLYRRLEENVQLLDYECLEFETPFLPWDEPPAPGLAGPPGRSR